MSPRILLVCEGLTNDDVGVARGTVFQEVRPGASFKTCEISLEKSWGGCRSKTQGENLLLVQARRMLRYIEV